MRYECLLIVILFLLIPGRTLSQDKPDILDNTVSLPGKLLDAVNKKTCTLGSQLTNESASYLKKLAKQDRKLKDKIAKIDSVSSTRLFPNGIDNQYEIYTRKLKSDSLQGNRTSSGIYYPYTDSIHMTLLYLQSHPQLMSKMKITASQLTETMANLSQLQAKLNYSDQINQFVSQRKQQFQQLIGKYSNVPSGLNKTYSKYAQQASYYKEQVKTYREQLNDPGKVMNLTLSLLSKIPSFNSFVKKNSMISSLFNIPGNVDSSKTVQGLQTRKQIQPILEEKMGVQGNMAFSKIQSSVQSAAGFVDGLQNKLNASGNGDISNPEFQGNDQRTKSFLHRVEYGANLQTTTGRGYFPITTDIAASAGYRLNKFNIVGLGIAYKIGWGSDIHHIRVTSQGIGLRSFIDLKIDKTFFASGGFEYNYQQPFDPMHLFDHMYQNWAKSGLIGISKIVNLKSKFVKKSKIQVLWDFFSYQQIPRTQPFIFRVGYSF